ncbi:MAG: outer membrane protein heavy metal efflux system [Chthoniobacter sp.]|jgi:outer membrane protein TolC|nr:outer membrane protein heavy metal efflux system [Chthoniobacter sp.]
MKPIPFLLCSFSILLTALAEPPQNSGGGPARSSAADQTLALGSVTQAVLANNPSIKEARARWEAMKQREPQAAAWDDLKVGARTRLGRFVEVATNSFTDQMLSVEQVIPISGKNQSRARIAAAEALGGLEELRRKELEVVAKARAAYFRLAKDYALLELNRGNDASLAQTLEISRARLEVGNQGPADVLTAEGELARIAETRRDLERAISDEATQLKVLMNRDPFSPLGRPAASSAPATLPSVERLRGLLFANRPEVRMAEAGVTAAKAKLELAKREWIPDPAVSIEAQRYNRASQAASEVSAGLSFNVPWLNGKKYRAGEKEAQSGVEAAQRALEGARLEALGLLRDQLQRIDTFHHHLELFEARLLPNARQTVQTNRTNYEGGKAGFLELVLSDRSLREVEALFQQHLADYQMAVAELEALVGADLNLFSPPQVTSKRKSK